jgi:hypothetical protein
MARQWGSSRRVLAAVLALAPLSACDAIWGIDPPTLAEGGLDGGSEGGPSDGHADGRPPGDSGRGDGPLSDTRTADVPGDGPSGFDGHCAPGTSPVTLVTDSVGGPHAIAADEAGVYWTDINTGKLGVLRFGSPPVVGFGPDGGTDNPENLAVAGGEIVWAGASTGQVFACSTAGCGGEQVIAPSQPGVAFVATNGASAFWNDMSGVMSCTLPACGPVLLYSTSGFSGLTLDSQYVYWSDSSGNIQSIPLIGGFASPAVPTNTGAARVGTGNGSLYWWGTLGISTCPIDGGVCEAPPTLLVGGLGLSSRFAVDDKHIYVADENTGNLRRAPLDGGAPDGAPVLHSAPHVTDVAVGETCVFWSQDQSGGGVFAAPK